MAATSTPAVSSRMRRLAQLEQAREQEDGEERKRSSQGAGGGFSGLGDDRQAMNRATAAAKAGDGDGGWLKDFFGSGAIPRKVETVGWRRRGGSLEIRDLVSG